MRGGYVHNRVLLDPLDDAFLAIGSSVQREYRVHLDEGDGSYGSIDLLVEHRGMRIACEAELSADRVINDVRKANSAHADALLIVVPNRRVRRAVESSLRRKSRSVRGELAVFVLTQPAALRWVTDSSSLIAAVNANGNQRNQTATPGVRRSRSKGSPK